MKGFAASLVGLALLTPSLAFASPYYHHEREVRRDNRELRHDEAALSRVQARLAANEYRLGRDQAMGRHVAAAREHSKIFVEKRQVAFRMAEIRHDQRKLARDLRRV